MINKDSKFLQDNYGWIVAGLTGIGVFLSFVLKFVKYINSKVLFSYYGISYGLYNTAELGFFFDLLDAILWLLLLCSAFYCLNEIPKIIKSKEKRVIKLIINGILIIISNLYFIYYALSDISFISIIIMLPVLILTEIIVLRIFFSEKTDEQYMSSAKDWILNILKIFPFWLLFLIVCLCSSKYVSLKNTKEYQIIDDKQVIVYATNAYYVVLDCEISDGSLIIYKGKQTRIDNNNIKSDIKKFNNVKVK